MKEKSRSAYYFKQTCPTCFNDIAIPLLGPFAEPEREVQSKDGQSFFIMVLVGHPAAEFVSKELAIHGIDTPEMRYRALICLADNNSKELSDSFPNCTHCNHHLYEYGDANREDLHQLDYLTWEQFNALEQIEKRSRIEQALYEITRA